MRYDDYIDADEQIRREGIEAEKRRAEQERHWERVWQAAVAIFAAHSPLDPEVKNLPEWTLDEAEALVEEWERRRRAQDREEQGNDL